MQLANRMRQVPGGLKFYIPQTKWASPGGSFNTIVDAVIAHRRANPWLNQSVDRPTVENEVDQFNAKICEANGWTDFITGGDPSPPLPPPPSVGQRLAAVAGAVEPLVEWIASKEEAVPSELANKRAAVCAACPMNNKGDLLTFFTKAVSEAIRKALSVRSGWNLTTPDDYRLGTCSGCSCPIRLMCHVPLAVKLKTLRPETLAQLHPDCWVTKEQADLKR